MFIKTNQISAIEGNMSEKQSTVIEEYLLLLYHLRDAGEKLKSVTLAQELKTKPPTVHATLQRMQRDGLVKFDKKKEIFFTAEGEKYAKDIAFRHNLANIFYAIRSKYHSMKFTNMRIFSSMQ